MSCFVIDPTRIYEVKGQVSKVASSAGNATTGSGKTIVAAVSGSIIRVMGWTLQAQTVAATINFKSSGGTLLHDIVSLAAATDCKPDRLPMFYSGYFETLVGEGLVADVAGGSVYHNVYYITYQP